MNIEVNDERIEIIQGQAMPLASPAFGHGAMAMVLSHALNPWQGPGGGSRPGGWWLSVEVDVRIGADMFVPDIAGWRIDKMPTAPSSRPVEQPPDWVCEILSPSTAARDISYKQAAYHAAGVGHLWLVSPTDRTLLILERDKRRYSLVDAGGIGSELQAPPFDGLHLVLDDLLVTAGLIKPDARE